MAKRFALASSATFGGKVNRTVPSINDDKGIFDCRNHRMERAELGAVVVRVQETGLGSDCYNIKDDATDHIIIRWLWLQLNLQLDETCGSWGKWVYDEDWGLGQGPEQAIPHPSYVPSYGPQAAPSAMQPPAGSCQCTLCRYPSPWAV